MRDVDPGERTTSAVVAGAVAAATWAYLSSDCPCEYMHASHAGAAVPDERDPTTRVIDPRRPLRGRGEHRLDV